MFFTRRLPFTFMGVALMTEAHTAHQLFEAADASQRSGMQTRIYERYLSRRQAAWAATFPALDLALHAAMISQPGVEKTSVVAQRIPLIDPEGVQFDVFLGCAEDQAASDTSHWK